MVEDYWEEFIVDATESTEELGSCYDEHDYLYWKPEPMKSEI